MDCKMPPNWIRNIITTLNDEKSYRSFPVGPSSTEYSVICSLLDSVQVQSVEQVVNPTLWDEFDQMRKDMLKSKSIDRKELSAIGLSTHEVNEALVYTYEFTAHPEVDHVPYDTNMALLFHCTGTQANIESILTEGLDERLGNGSGLLGRGIYFTDNPKKSMSYDGCNTIFIFAVLLGDCLSMDKKRTSFIREPKKEEEQKRHINDIFFDSIAGRPNGDSNEFVIYNRYQCIPLYKVKYEKPSISSSSDNGHKFDSDEYVQARKDIPEFCWKSNEQYKHPMPSIRRLENSSWPFNYKKIFEKMEVNKTN